MVFVSSFLLFFFFFKLHPLSVKDHCGILLHGPWGEAAALRRAPGAEAQAGGRLRAVPGPLGPHRPRRPHGTRGGSGRGRGSAAGPGGRQGALPLFAASPPPSGARWAAGPGCGLAAARAEARPRGRRLGVRLAAALPSAAVEGFAAPRCLSQRGWRLPLCREGV